MAPFIKITQKTASADGPSERWHYINMSLVSSAEYNTEKGTMILHVAAGDDDRVFHLADEEATNALKLLQDLK